MKIVKEVMDGIRVYFDFTLSSLLLYNMERDQHERVMKEPTVKREYEVKTEKKSENNQFVEKPETKTETILDETATKPSIKLENATEKSSDESKGTTQMDQL